MQAVLPLLPCAVVIVAVLVAGSSGMAAAAASLAATIALVAVGAFDAPSAGMAAATVQDAALLTLLVAATLVPGVFFIEATSRLQSPQAIAHLVETLRLPVPQATVLIAVGLGVLVESLTGMGVSLLLTVPLLTSLLSRNAAIATALVGMSLMPWGALALAGTVGSTLASIDQHEFGIAIWRYSGVVAALLPLLATLIAGGTSRVDLVVALVCGVTLWASTGLASVFIGMPLAGVAGGLAVMGLLALRADASPAQTTARRARALRPYAVLILAVVLQTLAVQMLAYRGIAPTVTTGRVAFVVLTSPGVALLAATLIAAGGTIDFGLLRSVLQRSWRAVASVALFMLTARLLVAAGAIDVLTVAIKGYGPLGALAAVTGLGAIGGFVTGSGVTGNALFLPSAAAAGAALSAKSLFAAIASAAAGHAAMASLPVAALLLTALPDRSPADDRAALRWGLALTSLYLVVLFLIGVVWLRTSPV